MAMLLAMPITTGTEKSHEKPMNLSCHLAEGHPVAEFGRQNMETVGID